MKIATKVLGKGPSDFENIIKAHPVYELKGHLLHHSADIADKDGFWAEFGVYSGTTLHAITEHYAPVYGFDSFKGLPEKWNEDNPMGIFDLDGKRPFTPTKNMIIIEGWFEESLPTLLKQTNIGTPKFLHLDADLYSSTKCVLDEFKPHFKDSCVMVFDEFYNYDGWQNHEYKALYEFLNEMSDKIYSVELIGYAMDVYCPLAIKIKLKS